MAANEVIFFLFWAQLSLRRAFPAPPEPVAESPPRWKLLNALFIRSDFRSPCYSCALTDGTAQLTVLTGRNASIPRLVSRAWKGN